MASSQARVQPCDVHVLLVDDDNLSRVVAASQLRKCRYRVTVVESGAEALDVLRNSAKTFHLLLTDVMMPGVSGRDLLREVRQSEQLRDMPVIMMSSSEQDETVFDCIQAGADDYILKPVAKKDITHLWQHVWRHQRKLHAVPDGGCSSEEAGEGAPSEQLVGVPSGQRHRSRSSLLTDPPAACGAEAADGAPARPQPSDAVVGPHAGKPGAASAAEDDATSRPAQPPEQEDSAGPSAHPAAAYSPLEARPRLSMLLRAPVAALAPRMHDGMAGGRAAPLRSWLVQRRAPGSGELPELLDALLVFRRAVLLVMGAHAHHTRCWGLRPSRLVLTAAGDLRRHVDVADGSDPSDESAGEFAWECDLYSAPEEVAGECGGLEADLYALGALLLELLLRAPCEGSGDDARRRALKALRAGELPPELLRDFPREAALVRRLCDRDASKRPSPSEVLERLTWVLPGEKQVALEASVQVEVQRVAAGVVSDVLQRTREKHLARAKALEAELAGIVEARELLELPGAAEGRPASKRRRAEEGDAVPASGRGELELRAAERLDSLRDSTVPLLHEELLRCLEVHGGGGAVAGGETKGADAAARTASAPAGAPAPASRSRSGALHGFAKVLANFTRYRRLEERVSLARSELPQTGQMVCSVAFDRDAELVGTAGVSKRIRVFDYGLLTDSAAEVHCPVVEMASRSKLSSIAFNPYIKSQIASADYEGVVQLWDVTRMGCSTAEFDEHKKRVWSVSFSPLDPTRLASCSDDGTVRVWNVVQEATVACVRSKANVCSVHFSETSPHLLAFGSADYRAYCYDLRRPGAPLAVLSGHSKAVSYVRWAGSSLVTASTDSTLRLWDVEDAAAHLAQTGVTLDTACTRVFTGHTNEKNFVGLSVSPDGYIACGSEDNSVCVYHRDVPAVLATYPFETSEPSQFVSAVCWRGGPASELVVGNSAGDVKLLSLAGR